MFLRIKFALVYQRLTISQCRGLPFIEPDKAAQALYSHNFLCHRKPCTQLFDNAFQTWYFIFVSDTFFRHLLTVILLYFQQLAVVLGLHRVYAVLQYLNGFLMGGNFPIQGGVLPFQSLDLVAPEKRTDTFSYVGRCGGGCTFQFLGLYLFLGLSEFLFGFGFLLL